MKRFWIIAPFSLIVLHGAAEAQTTLADPVIARIEAEGFTVSEVSRTWLGRILIVAEDQTSLREVVLNRTTGEIMRDRRFPRDALPPEPIFQPDNQPDASPAPVSTQPSPVPPPPPPPSDPPSPPPKDHGKDDSPPDDEPDRRKNGKGHDDAPPKESDSHGRSEKSRDTPGHK